MEKNLKMEKNLTVKKSLFALAAVVLLGTAAHAQRIELGAGAGKSHPIAGSDFKDEASSGDVNNYWLGYGLTKTGASSLA